MFVIRARIKVKNEEKMRRNNEHEMRHKKSDKRKEQEFSDKNMELLKYLFFYLEVDFKKMSNKQNKLVTSFFKGFKHDMHRFKS